MLRYALIVAFVLLCGATWAQSIRYECLRPPVEMRGVWVDAASIPKTKAGVRALVRDYRKANINVLFPEVIARGYTVYPSKLVARDPRFAGSPDELAAMIAEAHKVGMEVHPWVWVFRAGYTKDRGAILTAHPQWAELSRNGKELSTNGGFWISPCVGEARDFLAQILAELVQQYDVDGLHLDYVRYESEAGVPYGYCEASRSLFKRQYLIDPLDLGPDSPDRYAWNKFRERQINTFVQRIALQTRWIKPHVLISVAVGPHPKMARLELMQNWVNWVDNKWVDFVVPMSYSGDDQNFRNLMIRERDAVGCRTILAPGIGIFAQKATGQMLRQIAAAREMSLGGQTLFSSSYLKAERLAVLSVGPYSTRAGLPFRNPWARSRDLCEYAAELRHRGRTEEADYYAAQARNLADYAFYQESHVPYVRPQPVPFNQPEPEISPRHIIPLTPTLSRGGEREQ